MRLPVALLLVLSPVLGAAPDPDVREACLVTYVHGMTATLAQQEVGPSGVPALLELLDDPAFPRRDNVVAFLAYLAGDEATVALVDLLRDPPAPVDRPEEDRALLLAPEALGRITARGGTRALDVLLALSGADGGGPAAAAVAAGRYPDSMRDDLIESALHGLALAGTPAAERRLLDVASGAVVPNPGGRDPAPAARRALALLGWNRSGAALPPTPSADAAPPSASDANLAATAAGSTVTSRGVDGSPTSHDSGLDYANHPNVGLRIDDTRVDRILGFATRAFGIRDFPVDTACCVTLTRVGGGGVFGAPADGLDVIDDDAELDAVLGDPIARIKVVRLIRYCVGPTTNTIGCARVGGYGIAVVRQGGEPTEGILWAHEYGHNVGLGHTSEPNHVMRGTISGSNVALSESDCDRFHSPSANARALLLDIGTCQDDGDDFADPIDNCPAVSNQTQGDNDRDGLGNVCDNCPDAANAQQFDFDADGVGDACEAGARLADADRSLRVDGLDLAALGRAFGSRTGDALYDRSLDYDRDGQVDGNDLAILVAHFGASVS